MSTITLLASVRSADEAIEAAAAGADLIDLKEPRAGALGGLPPEEIRSIVALLRARWPRLPISATIGDLDPADDPVALMRARVPAVAATGVDYVKVGIAPGPRAWALLHALKEFDRAPARVVPVVLADHGIASDLVARICALQFPVLMVDTADKAAGSLFDCVTVEALQRLLQSARAHGLRCGLAGSLKFEHVPLLKALAPSIAGFRGALCSGARTERFEPIKLRALRAALQAAKSDAVGYAA
jgi:uncharacterized protein (UPF0264 family)